MSIDHKAHLQTIEDVKAAEKRLVKECMVLIEPLLTAAGKDARIVLYPRD